MVANIDIAGRLIGEGQPCFIIAEAGVNHNGDINLAKQLIDAAADAGADAVKFQTFKAENIVSFTAPKAEYQLKTTAREESQFEMLQRLELSPDQHNELSEYAISRDILFLSTPFDDHSVELLNQLDIPCFKISSGEVTNLPFLRFVASREKPIILSTGMSYLGEIDTAIQTILATGNSQIVILHCVSNYPADVSDINLRAMLTIKAAFKVLVGYSDHSVGIGIPIAAAAMGAKVIEKHFTLDKNLPGPDHQASLEPNELVEMINEIRNVEFALGDGIKIPRSSELGNRKIIRRSLAAARDLESGEVLTTDMFIPLRPASGISPNLEKFLVGRILCKSVNKGQLIDWSDVE
jgi:N,N'-diacetyllegionaminate synthase